MADTLRDVPEFFENEVGEALAVRTESLAAFRDLGPPDLCHVTKVNTINKSAIKEIGSYHNVLGADASSSASLAAYINSLTYSVDDSQGWFTKTPTWKIRSGIFCCYNAFSHVDVRVEVRIPGGVDSYAVTPRGERIATTAQLWQECHVSATLRAILYSEEGGYRLHALRRVYPLASTMMENRFLESCAALYWQGWQLGSNSEVQMTTPIRNYLNDGLLKYFEDCGRFTTAAKFYESLYPKDAEVGALLARCYFGANLEVKGVRILHEALQKSPASYSLLHAQVDFLLRKKKFDAAIQLAKYAVKCAPSEFLAWAKLTEAYVTAERFELALLTLNSCPMFTFTDKDYPRMPQPAKVHLPVKTELSNVMDLSDYEPKLVDPAESYLLRLPAPGLRGTFSKAYGFLAQLVKKVGWDELLRLRSAVFVMEDEYRQQKAREDTTTTTAPDDNTTTAASPVAAPVRTADEPTEPRAASPTPPTSGTPTPSSPPPAESETLAAPDEVRVLDDLDHLHLSDSAVADDVGTFGASQDGSVRTRDPLTSMDSEFEDAVGFQPSHERPGADNGEDRGTGTRHEEDPDVDGQSMISVDIEAESRTTATDDQTHDASAWATAAATTTTDADEITTQPDPPADTGDGPVVVRDADPRTPGTSAPFTEKQPPQATAAAHRDPIGSIHHKRLCERWLDNLFMVLYEDLRAYIDSMSEIYRSQANPQSTFRHTAAEWEALGDLAWRLLYKAESKEAYIHSVQQRFSPKPWLQLLTLYTEEGNLQMALNAVVQLAIYQERWYNEMIYPSAVAAHVVTLIREHGLSKVQNVLISMNLAPPLHRLVTRYFAFAQAFQMEGSEW
ncbi:bud site selection protein [Tieghemiomyces parasiticus]|uniref:Bud site selection protein n=1 Tax=Tieghemiomyces parasiticus TaxID=78921 RepID=A0A9W8AL03_9FUNG|nr:bud site selection protein [Tieghemiomyces parasiticus]